MRAWILVPCLVSLRDEFGQLAPGRDTTSDGAVGDLRHAASMSDHNPDEVGRVPVRDADDKNEVHGLDVDSDLRKAGWTMTRAVNIIVDRHRRGEDDRLQNIIWNQRIASRSWGWEWQDYTGPSGHTEHAHFSARYTTAQEASTRPWGLLAADVAGRNTDHQEDDVTPEEIDKIATAVITKLGKRTVKLTSACATRLGLKPGDEVLADILLQHAVIDAEDNHRDLASLVASTVEPAAAPKPGQ